MNTVYYMIIIGIAVTGIIYGAAAAVITAALKKVRKRFMPRQLPVTVVIAARNERRTIGTCLAALANQDYPPGLVEIIVADDRSCDGTADVIDQFCTVFPSLRRITIGKVPAGVSPKKNALTHAIGHAHGDIILQTDADCEPPPPWISGMVLGFGQGVGMVAGVAPYHEEAGMLNSFVRHEYVWNAALSAASIVLGRGTHASSRNLGFRRDMFEQLGGYGASERVLSGDDTLLLHRFRRADPSSVVTMPLRSAHVPTHAPRSIAALLRQRIRHMSTGKYFDPVLVGFGFLVYGYHVLLALSLILSAFSGIAQLVFAGGFVWKLFWDVVVARRTHEVLELDIEWKTFPVNELLLVFYMAFLPILGTILPVRWKENS